MFQNVRQNEIIFYDKRQNNFLKLNFFHLHKNEIMIVILLRSIQVLNYQVLYWGGDFH